MSPSAALPTAPVVSVRPIRLDAPGRGTDLTVRVSAPTTGADLPVIVLSHGYHQSERGYDPLVDAWAQHFVVVQPTHLDSAALGLPENERRPVYVLIRDVPDINWGFFGKTITLDDLMNASPDEEPV